jgi:hypothetical protein
VEAIQQKARAAIEELDRLRRPALADAAVVLEARVEDGTIVIETD